MAGGHLGPQGEQAPEKGVQLVEAAEGLLEATGVANPGAAGAQLGISQGARVMQLDQNWGCEPLGAAGAQLRSNHGAGTAGAAVAATGAAPQLGS